MNIPEKSLTSKIKDVEGSCVVQDFYRLLKILKFNCSYKYWPKLLISHMKIKVKFTCYYNIL